MRNLPSDFIAAVNADDAPVSMLVLKLASGDVKFSDGLYGEGLPFIESISEEQDGGSFENYLSRGNLETCKLSVTLIYSDLSRSTIHSVISELQSMSADNLRCRAELWKKFVDIDGNDTCLPLLWNIYAVQDNSENFACREDRMLFPLELITLPGSENQKLSITNDPEKSYDYVIGKAEGLPLQLMEGESSKWTELLGDADGNGVTAEYTGMIRVKDATKLPAGINLINGEKVSLLPVSAGYMRLTARAQSGTEAQEHASGSRIFPAGAVFKYAVCAGPVGSIEKLRTSNEIDVYDDDENGNTTEYRDLYSGGNEALRPDLNPAQIWFNGRMPFLMKDQNVNIEDKAFYGNGFTFTDKTTVTNPENINKKDNEAKISIDFQKFSEISTDYWYRDTTLCAPALPTDVASVGPSSYKSSGLNSGYFTISDFDGYRRTSVEISAITDSTFWTSIFFTLPEKGWWNYTGVVYYGQIIKRIVTFESSIRIKTYVTTPDGTDHALTLTPLSVSNFQSLGISVFGSDYDLTITDLSGIVKSWIPSDPPMWISNVINFNGYDPSVCRIKFKLTVLYKSASGFAYIDTGGTSVYSRVTHKGMATFWQYYDNSPNSQITSIFNRDLSSKGVFEKAKIRVEGKIFNVNNFASGYLTIFDSKANNIKMNIEDAVYDPVVHTIDFNPCPSVPNITSGDYYVFYKTTNGNYDNKSFKLTSTATPGVYAIDDTSTSPYTFPSTSRLVHGVWREIALSDGGNISETIETNMKSWGDLDGSQVTIYVSTEYAFDSEGLPLPRQPGAVGCTIKGGIQRLLTYTSTTLDGLQVNYADTLYVDAVSTRGPDWTPALAVQAIAADHTSWAGLIDTVNFDARHDEFITAGHFLNGTISGSSGSQDAIRTVLREGLAGLNYPLGKITMYSYLTDLAATAPVKSLMSIVRPDRESFPNRGFMQSANEMRSNRMFFRWNKNLSTGKYDGSVIKSDGTVFLNDQVVTFELVKSDIIGNSVANFLWNLWKYGYIIQDCEYPAEALAIEKHDLITSFSMADNDAIANFIVVSCSQTHESAKARRGLSAKITMIKR